MACSLLLPAFMTVPSAEGSGGSFGGGDGSAGNPYVIEDVWDLQNMSGNLGAHYVLGNDIDASLTSSWNSGQGFAPVGRETNPFTGSLDGADHTISGLFINRSWVIWVGIFGYIEGSVSHVGILDCDVTGYIYVGALVGNSHGGTVSNCHVTGTVRGDTCGALMGQNFRGTISDCYASADVIGTRNEIGGLVGSNNQARLTDCYATGKVSGYTYVGGLTGQSYKNVISNCYATGEVSGKSSVGGLIGRNTETTVSYCYATGHVVGEEFVGGLVGLKEASMVYSCYATGNVDGDMDVGGLTGWNSGAVSNSHYDIDSVMINRRKQNTIGGLYSAQYRDWYSNDLTLNISDYGTSLVPSGGYYTIGTVRGMRDLLGFADVTSLRFRLSADVDLATAPMYYIPYFAAWEFDGANHTLSNVRINMSNSRLGLFGLLRDGTIKDLEAVDISMTGHECVGGLVGYNDHGSVSNCRENGTVSGDMYVGGMMGWNGQGDVTGCRATGTVSGTESVGGLVGLNAGTVSVSHANATVTGGFRYSGGLIGLNYDSVDNCTAAGVVSGGDNNGGLVGYNDEGTIVDCVASGSVTGSTAGGLVSTNDRGTISTCYASANVDGFSEIGGLVGRNIGDVSSCYATGKVDGNRYIGGLVGTNAGGGSVFNCYAVGVVTGDFYLGGLMASNYGVVSHSFWDVRTSGQDSSNGGTGKSTTQMQTRSTFTDAGWDFTTVWFMMENVTYPILRWQNSRPPTAMAGHDQTVHLDGNGKADVVLDGGGSHDDFAIDSYTWEFDYDGSKVRLEGERVNFTFYVPGVYVVTLNVTDTLGKWDMDQVTVTVSDVTPPTPDAGPDQTVNEGTLVTFDGSGSSDNVGVVNWTWTFEDGGLVTLHGARPTYRFDNPGVFIVTMNVMDAAGQWTSEAMNVTVLDVRPPEILVICPVEDELTCNATYTVTGRTEPDTRVDIIVESSQGGRNYTTTSSEDGTFETPVELFEGVQYVIFTATDAAGNPSVVSVLVTLDTVPPGLIITLPEETYVETRSSTFQIIGQMSDDDQIRLLINTNQIEHQGIFLTEVSLEEGENVFEIKAVDEAGNEAVVVLTIVRDSMPPVLSVTVPEGERFATNDFTVHFEGTVTGATGVMVQHKSTDHPVKLVSGSLEDGVWEYDLELGPTDLEQYVVVRAYDLAGNEMTVSVLVILDTVPPSLAVDASVQYTNRTSFTVSGTTDETVGSARVNEVVGLVEGGVFEIAVDLEEGTNTLMVIVEDEAGNRAIETLVVTLDTVRPTYDLDYPESTKNKRATISGTCDDDVVRVWVDLDPYAVENGIYTIKVELEKDGMNAFVITFEDRAGNTATETITIKKNKGEATPGFGALLALISVGTLLALTSLGRRRKS